MNTRADDDDQFKALCKWHSGKADTRRRTDGAYRRWPTLLVAGACLIAMALMAAGRAEAGGTVTDSKYIWLQRSGVTLTDKTTPKLACPLPKTMLECAACMLEMIDTERRGRTTGYVTYRCMDVSQSYVKFNTTPVTPPPVASLQVYTCADAGADGRILESDTITWPNCSAASYKNPDRSLVVATNTGTRPLYWRLGSNATGRVGTQTDGVFSWTPVADINWGAAPTLGSATLRWTAPTQKVDGTPLDNLAGYRVMYGPGPALLVQAAQVPSGVTTTVVDKLTPGTWYFAVKAYNTAGTESGLGPIVTQVFP